VFIFKTTSFTTLQEHSSCYGIFYGGEIFCATSGFQKTWMKEKLTESINKKHRKSLQSESVTKDSGKTSPLLKTATDIRTDASGTSNINKRKRSTWLKRSNRISSLDLVKF